MAYFGVIGVESKNIEISGLVLVYLKNSVNE